MSRILGRSQTLSCSLPRLLPQRYRLHATSTAGNRTTEQIDRGNAQYADGPRASESAHNEHHQPGSSQVSDLTIPDTREVRARVRLPIIINGAGPAGLILAIYLKNANIPFEIFEKEEQNLASRKVRRNYVSHLSPDSIHILKKLLNFSTKQELLQEVQRMSINRLRTSSDIRRGTRVYTESLLLLLRQQVHVHYGHTLEHQAISCRESVITSQYVRGNLIQTFRACLIVGADGKFSAGRR